MKLFHSINVSVFSKEEEDKEKIKEKLISLFPFSLVDEKVKLNETVAKGFQEKKIIILEVLLKKERHIKAFIDNLVSNLSDGQKEVLIKQAESRLDEELCFFIRFDKDKFLSDEWQVTDSGNCFHIKMLVAVYPKKRDVALGKMIELLSPPCNNQNI